MTRRKPPQINFVPDTDATPGQNFAAILKKLGIRDEKAVKELSRKTRLNPSAIADIANDQETITPSIADLLERGTGIKREWWLMMVERCTKK